MSKKNQKSKKTSDVAPRTTAEWVSLGIALVLLAVVVGTVIALWINDSNQPARFRVDRHEARNEGDHFYLPITVTNEGDLTGAEVVVEGTLSEGGEEETATTTFDFIPSHSRAEAVLVFSRDPSQAVVRVMSYQKP